MRKRAIVAVSAAALMGVLGMSGCGSTVPAGSGTNSAQGAASADKGSFFTARKDAIAPEDLSAVAEEDVEKTVSALNGKFDELVAQVGTFDAYRGHVDAVQAYYDSVLAETKALGIRMGRYAADCASCVLADDRTPGQMYDDLEVIYDDLYDGAGDDVYDAIYDDLFERLYDAFYDGVVRDGYDVIGYGEWSEISSAAYEMYSDAMSEAYELISDARSDIYEFASDVRGDAYSDKIEKAEKELEKFREKVAELENEK